MLTIVLIRESTSLLLDDRRLSLKLGDITHNWEFKSIWNLIVINALLITLSFRGLHYWYFKHGHIPIQIRKTEHDFQIGRKGRLIIKFLEVYFVKCMLGYPFFFMQMITFSISCTLFELLTYGLFWSSFMLPCSIYAVECVINQCLYFCLLAYNFKLRLELENIRLKQLSIKQMTKDLTERQLLRIFSRIIDIYKQNREENKFWSKWLAIQILFSSNLCSLFINQLMFSKTNMSISLFFGFCLMVLLIYISIFSICCIKLHDESHKTVKVVRHLSLKLAQMKSTMHKRNLKVDIH